MIFQVNYYHHAIGNIFFVCSFENGEWLIDKSDNEDSALKVSEGIISIILDWIDNG